MLARIVLSLVLCGLVACGGNARAPVEDQTAQPQYSAYSVKRGDTLYSIAFRYGLDFRKVAVANGIAAPYTIYPGQKIYLDEAAPSVKTSAPAATPARPLVYTPLPGPVPPGSGASTPSTVMRSKPVVSEALPAPAPVGAPPVATVKAEAGDVSPMPRLVPTKKDPAVRKKPAEKRLNEVSEPLLLFVALENA